MAKTIRPEIQKIAKKYNANVKIVEVPPGPPVLSTIVAEVYGPNYDEQVKVAKQVEDILHKTDDVVDIDDMVEAPQTEFKVVADKEKAMLNGVAPAQIVGNLTYLIGEHPVGNLYDEKSNDAVDIVMKLNDADKSTITDITDLKIKGQMGNMVPVSDLVKIQREELQKTIYRKDQKRVVYVTADTVSYTHLDVYKRQSWCFTKRSRKQSGETIRENYLKYKRRRTRSFDGDERTSHDYRSVLCRRRYRTFLRKIV